MGGGKAQRFVLCLAANEISIHPLFGLALKVFAVDRPPLFCYVETGPSRSVGDPVWSLIQLRTRSSSQSLLLITIWIGLLRTLSPDATILSYCLDIRSAG